MHVRVMADVHNYGGTITLWGSWKKHGWALIGAGLLTHVCTERRNGREVLHARLLNAQDANGAAGMSGAFPDPGLAARLRANYEAIADLAARCAVGLERAKKIGDRLGRTVRPRWLLVPATLPPKPRPLGAVVCPGCFCSSDKPCIIRLPERKGSGLCVSAGILGFAKCSACLDGCETIDMPLADWLRATAEEIEHLATGIGGSQC